MKSEQQIKAKIEEMKKLLDGDHDTEEVLPARAVIRTLLWVLS